MNNEDDGKKENRRKNRKNLTETILSFKDIYSFAGQTCSYFLKVDQTFKGLLICNPWFSVFCEIQTWHDTEIHFFKSLSK